MPQNPRRRCAPLGWLLLLLLGCTPGLARAEFQPVVSETEPFTSAGSVQVGSLVGLAGWPEALVLGHDYDYSLTGPLLLDLGGYLLAGQDFFALRAVPGVKYKLLVPGLPFLPYGKAGLQVDLLFGDAAGDQTVALALRLGGGVRHFFRPDMALGAELGLSLGTLAGDESQTGLGVEALVGFEYLVP